MIGFFKDVLEFLRANVPDGLFTSCLSTGRLKLNKRSASFTKNIEFYVQKPSDIYPIYVYIYIYAHTPRYGSVQYMSL